MFRGAARLVVRVAGWLLTPLILIIAAAIGAVVGLVATTSLSPNAALGVTVVLALVAAAIALRLWTRLLKERPMLRHTLAMTTEGIPETELVERLVHPSGSAGHDAE
ncbi:MAG TPA: hypothetical protein VGL65_08345 [Gemmatimonadales bacterium]|jgi:membrane protein YdbS with pleckstrin-like domain